LPDGNRRNSPATLAPRRGRRHHRPRADHARRAARDHSRTIPLGYGCRPGTNCQADPGL